VDILEADVRDRVLILHGIVGDEHDRVVGALQEDVPLHLDVGGQRALEPEPDGAETDVPVQVERPGAHRRVVRDSNQRPTFVWWM